MVCQNGDDALLEYFLGRLPEETSSRLFKQLSREEGNTVCNAFASREKDTYYSFL